ncbi:MotA/TolQ/ExbB proton channel family protein [Fusobacterium sp. PH5-29]
MWILFALSILSLGIILERLLFFFRYEKGASKLFKSQVTVAMAANDKKKAIELCKNEKNCIGSSVKKFLLRCKSDGDFHHYEQLIKEIGMEEIGKLEKRLHVLAIIGAIAPMIGLLGTVTGMIDAFTNLSKFGAGDPTIVADGISKALVTTAAGLFIAIPAIVVYNLLNKKIESTEEEIDKIVTNIINIVRS